MIENGLSQVDKHKVVVLTLTYNHSKYIEDTLKGFAMQQTDFPFLCCVFDDASTDGEREVLKRWIENHCNSEDVKIYDHPLTILLMAPDKDNPNCNYAIHLQKVNTWGKPEKRRMIKYWENKCQYVALCEGDDYWIDPLKLQKQVDILESNADIHMCVSDCIVYQGSKILDWSRYPTNKIVPMEDIICGGGLMFPTASFVFRSNIYKTYPDFCKKCHVGDYPLILYAASIGNVFYIAEKQVVYRYMSDGSWTLDFNKKKDILKILNGAKSEVEMLRGMNTLTYYQFDRHFKSRIAVYLYTLILSNIKNYKEIRLYFKDIYYLMPFKERLVIFLHRIKIYDKLINIKQYLAQAL